MPPSWIADKGWIVGEWDSDKSSSKTKVKIWVSDLKYCSKCRVAASAVIDVLGFAGYSSVKKIFSQTGPSRSGVPYVDRWEI